MKNFVEDFLVFQLIIIDEFQTLIRYSRELQFEEDPNYGYIKNIFAVMFNRYGFSWDYKFDWYSRIAGRTSHLMFPTEPPIFMPSNSAINNIGTVPSLPSFLQTGPHKVTKNPLVAKPQPPLPDSNAMFVGFVSKDKNKEYDKLLQY